MTQTYFKPIARLSTEVCPLLRINFNIDLHNQMPKAVSKLMADLSEDIAAEFQIPKIDAFRYFMSRDPNFHQFVVDILRYKGWKISYWQLPDPDTQNIVNFGYEIEENCPRLIQYKLANT